ncbi:MAG: hypothetical protein QM736_04355 [Vicinamibacterales bacterium]
MLHRLARVEVVGELDAAFFLAVDHLRHPLAALPQQLAQTAEELGIFGKGFDEDPACALECRGHIGDPRVDVDEACRLDLGHACRIGEQQTRQRLEPRFTRDLRLRPPLQFIRQVQVLEARLRLRVGDLRRELRRQLALLVDALQHGGTPFFQLAQVGQSFLERAQLRVVESARRFLAVAGDERHGGFVVEQRDGSGHLRYADVQFFGNAVVDRFHAGRRDVLDGIVNSGCTESIRAKRGGVDCNRNARGYAASFRASSRLRAPCVR